ncbi:MAG: Ldh family oxidoreductase [Burkholderiaceae bacterium]
MSENRILSLAEATDLTRDALGAAGAAPLHAEATACALVRAQSEGLASHGLSRVPQYASFLRNGRARGDARPSVRHERAAAVLIDADDGLAFAACAMGVREAMNRADGQGVAIAAITNSHHFGVAAHHLLPAAEAGLVGLALGNSPAAMPVPGGRRPILGTNPLAAVFPRPGADPLVIDLSLSEVARGRIALAANRGEPIPAGWALDADGEPTTDARAALGGSMLPLGSAGGSAKGGMIALLIELLAVTLTGAQFGAEADSFFEDAGNRPRLGQIFILIDPGALAGRTVYADRLEALIAAMVLDPQVRLPGARRNALRRRAQVDGLLVPATLVAQIEALVGL